MEEEVVEARTASHGGIIYRKPYKRGKDGNKSSSPYVHNESSPRYSPRSQSGRHQSRKSRDDREAASKEEQIENREQEQRYISAEKMARVFGEKENKYALEGDGNFVPTKIDGNISKSLLASSDKFMQRRRATEWQEQESKREQEEFEAEVAARYARASKGPPAPFKGVEQRAAWFDEKAGRKREALMKAKESEFDQKRKEFQQSLANHVRKGFHY